METVNLLYGRVQVFLNEVVLQKKVCGGGGRTPHSFSFNVVLDALHWAVCGTKILQSRSELWEMGEKRSEPGTVMGCHPEQVLAHSRMSVNTLGWSGTQLIHLLLSPTQGRPSWNLALWADAKARWAISPHHIHRQNRRSPVLPPHPTPLDGGLW